MPIAQVDRTIGQIRCRLRFACYGRICLALVRELGVDILNDTDETYGHVLETSGAAAGFGRHQSTLSACSAVRGPVVRTRPPA
jgi:hypothetical protein